MTLRCVVINAMFWGCLSGAALGEDLETAKKLPDKVREAWRTKYPQAKVLSVEMTKELTAVKASDSLNDSFTASFDNEGNLIEQSIRKIKRSDLPSDLQDKQKTVSGFKWEETAECSMARNDKLSYKCLGTENGRPVYTIWGGDGRLYKFGPVMTPEEEKAAAEAEAKLPAPIPIKVVIDKEGQIVYDGKKFSDDDFKKKLMEFRDGTTRLAVELHYQSWPSDKRRDEISEILNTARLKSLDLTSDDPKDQSK